MCLPLFIIALQFSVGYSDNACDEKLVEFEMKLAALESFTLKLARKLEVTEKTLDETKDKWERSEKAIKALETENFHIREQLQKANSGLKNMRINHYSNAFNKNRTMDLNETKVKAKSLKQNSVQKRLLIGNVNTTIASPSSHRIGFTAVTTDHQMHMGIDHTVHFPKVITNVGNGFDPFTGIFRAPVSGLYLISASILSHSGQEVRCAITKNGGDIANIFSGDSTTYSTGAKSVLLDLVANDDVWVKIFGRNDVHIYGYSWSSFMGVLISP